MSESKWTQYMYYVIIGVLSLIMLVFMPMLGTEIGLQWDIPDTKVGWVVWIISKLCSASFNVMIFHCFNKQGKQNIRDNDKYKKAQEILIGAKGKLIADPRSPKQYASDIYTKKGLTIFLTTILGTIGLGQAILTFNPLEFIVQAISLVIGLIFGFLQMKNTEDYYTQEYLDYANMIAKKEEQHVHD